MGNTLFFTAADDNSGIQKLWKTDGNTVTRITQIGPNGYGYPLFLTGIADTLYFSRNDGTSGYELWKTDGSAVTRIADINPGPDHSYPKFLTAVGDTIFFSATDGISGSELWKTDGNTVSLVADIRPGGFGSYPRNLTAVGDTLFFSANDGINGFEIWKTDGTTVTLVGDLNPGTDGSVSGNLTAVGDTLFFTAFDGTSGRELWAVDQKREPDRYLAFSGGGWNTHSLLAGLFAGALDVMEERGSAAGAAMDDLMKNVKGIGAISGGSWFLSHLAYSQNSINSSTAKPSATRTPPVATTVP